MSEIELKAGDYVEKVSGYRFTGTVVSAFETLAGKRRVVVDNGDGMLHIFNEGQMRPATLSQSERVSRLEEALKGLARHVCFSAYSAAQPLSIRFDFTNADDRLAAANALDEAFAALNQGADDGQ